VKRSSVLTAIGCSVIVATTVAGLAVLLNRIETLPPLAGGWESKLRRETPSPNGSLVVSVLDWDGGATTSSETEVTIGEKDAPNRDRIALLRGSPNVSVRWRRETALTLTLPREQIKEFQKSWHGVLIELQQGSP
jgi:hypothetical protein